MLQIHLAGLQTESGKYLKEKIGRCPKLQTGALEREERIGGTKDICLIDSWPSISVLDLCSRVGQEKVNYSTFFPCYILLKHFTVFTAQVQCPCTSILQPRRSELQVSVRARALFLWWHLKFSCAKALCEVGLEHAAFARESLSCPACDASRGCGQRTSMRVTAVGKWYVGGVSCKLLGKLEIKDIENSASL